MQEEEKQAQTGDVNDENQENNSSSNSKTPKKKTVKRKRASKKTTAKKATKADTSASAEHKNAEETGEKSTAPKRKKATRKRKKKTTAAQSSDEKKTETTDEGKQTAKPQTESKVTSEPEVEAADSSAPSQAKSQSEHEQRQASHHNGHASMEKTQRQRESSPPASASSANYSAGRKEESQAAPQRRYSSFSEGIFDDTPAPAIEPQHQDEMATYDPDMTKDADTVEKTQDYAVPDMPITILPKDEEEDEELNELAIADDAVPEDDTAAAQDDRTTVQDDRKADASEAPAADATDQQQAPQQQKQTPRVIVEQATSSSDRNSRNGRRHHSRDNYGPRDKQRDSRSQQNKDQRSSSGDEAKADQSQQQKKKPSDQQQNRNQQDNRNQRDNRNQQQDRRNQQQNHRDQEQDRRNQQQDRRNQEQDQQDNRKSQQQKQPSQQRDQQKSSSGRGKQSREQDQKSAQSTDTAIAPLKGNKREMLINMAQDEECRIAVVEKGRLEELYIERKSSDSHVGNIYKGRITNVEPSIQACFVDFGIGQNGFLHISDLQSCYFPKSYNNQKERVGCKRPRRDRPPIQECIKRGQELIVQITKEGIGTKGPTLTTYLSIPGRFLVLMPGMNRMGISRKIEDEETRLKAKKLLQQLDPPKDMGFILRTAGLGRAKRDIQRDMTYLTRLWETIQGEIDSKSPPALLYQESDLVIRTVRDVFNSNIIRIICDREETVDKVNDFLNVSMPRTKCQVILYQDHQPLFNRYRIDEEIQKIQARHVPLQSGGSLVIDPTEAIIAIDVNSGKYRVHDDAETTAFRINMEAAPEIARQLKLRDLGGVIIMDFIDMLQEKHRREIERTLRDAVSTDRARTKILRMSQFGIIEMTRQRMRPSLKRSTYMDCPHCNGSGLLKTPETAAIQILRQIQSLAMQSHIATIEVNVSIDVASFLLNQKRQLIMEMESAHNSSIDVLGQKDYSNEMMTIVTRDRRGSVLNTNQ